MAVAFGAATEIAAGATASPTTGTHTPSGTPRGVEVTIVHEGSSDIITGVTYGGVALTRLLLQQDVLGEFGSVYQYFLGSGVPTGTQTVSISRTDNTTPIQAVVRTLTAGGDIDVVDTAGANGSGAPTGTGNVANPFVDLSYGGRTCIALGAMWNAVNSPASITDGTGLTRDADHDFGSSSAVQHHQTTPGSTDFTYGNTVATNNYAMVASAFAEGATTTTKFYTDVNTNDNLLLPFSASWTSEVGGTIQQNRLNTDRSGTSRTTTGGSLPTTSGDYLFRQFVSRALDVDQTITGTVSMVFSCSEVTATADAYFAYILRVLAPNGQVRGVLSAQLTSVGPTEFPTTAATRVVVNDPISSVDALAGDRIVLELGVHGVTPAAGAGNVLIDVGVQPALADYPLSEGVTGTGVGWMEIDQIITFVGANDVFGFGAATTSLSASASGTATNNAQGSTGSGSPSKTLSASASGVATQKFTGSGAPSKTLSASASGSATQNLLITGSGAPALRLSASATGTANSTGNVTASGAVTTSLRAVAHGVATNPDSPVVRTSAKGGGRRIRFEFVDDEPEPPKKRKKKKRPQPEAVEVVSVEPEELELPAFAGQQIDPSIWQRAASIRIPEPLPTRAPVAQPTNPMLQGSVEDRLLHHFLQVVGAHAMPRPDLTNAPHLLMRFLQMEP